MGTSRWGKKKKEHRPACKDKRGIGHNVEGGEKEKFERRKLQTRHYLWKETLVGGGDVPSGNHQGAKQHKRSGVIGKKEGGQ